MTQFVECDAQVLKAQIGVRNILSISGGRVGIRETGITLPVSHGYSVTIDLAGNDLYVVSRVFTRAGKVWVKGTVEDVYDTEIGRVAYEASCYVNVEFGKVA